MNRTLTGVVLALVAIVAVVFIVIGGNDNDGNPTTANNNDTNSSSTESQTENSNNTSENNTSTAEPSADVKEVEIKGFAFSPSKIQVKNGTRVTWTNQDSVQHTVTPDTESDNFKGSELMSKGESYSFIFEAVGTYTYHCSPHPHMKGTVEVVE